MTPDGLKAKREELGLSQAQLARAVGVEAGRTVRKWENGERDIPGPVVVLLKLADTFAGVRRWLIARGKSD